MGKKISQFLSDKEKSSEKICDLMIDCQSNTFDDLKILNHTIKAESDHLARLAFKGFYKFIKRELFFGKTWHSPEFKLQTDSFYTQSLSTRVNRNKKWKFSVGNLSIDGMRPILSLKFSSHAPLSEKIKALSKDPERTNLDFTMLFNERIIRIAEGYKANSSFPLKKDKNLIQLPCALMKDVKIVNGKV